ncbi:MAG: alpha-glucan family phosphorylase [Cryobacterium sp.]|nr:alpha-glucan family phosphorylase [Cryobacterium sp.]
MKAIRRFTVRPVLPESLLALEELATNLRWSWHWPTEQLFRDLSPVVWEEQGGDPVRVLGALTRERIAELAQDQDFIDRANALKAELDEYLTEPRWYQSLTTGAPKSIAYFSPEFGISSVLPQYSGGLGILAGDHMKSASDLGVPVIGIGLFYKSGYFSQAISTDGWQQESYPIIDPDGLPLDLLRHVDGSAAKVSIAIAGEQVLNARIWQAKVGRNALLLLDSDVSDNPEELRSVTDRLYGGGGEHRLLQELLLGVGGMRALTLYCGLRGIGLPEVFHTNEGHASFLGVERISNLIGDGYDFSSALEVVRAQTVFTTHTPVAAGIDRFETSLVRSYLDSGLLPGMQADQVLELGAESYPGGDPDVFNLAVMGLHLSQRANGVSKLHGEVSRKLFGALWPQFDSAEVPIGSITNGVHSPTWTSQEVARLSLEKLGAADPASADWTSDKVTDREIWQLRNALRSDLVEAVRKRVIEAWRARHGRISAPASLEVLLDSSALTIGFARRVPTYKRLTLMLHDEDRLGQILTNKNHPVQIVVAGKSHPADDEGKRMIQRLVQFSSLPEIRGKLVFLPDFDMAIGRELYAGSDVWLNNPLRPFEACGTSGMKAALNGALNMSILDGWWAEYFDGENGWAIPSADSAGDSSERDSLESAALYDLIENQVAPRFYDRDGEGVPNRWIETVRHSLGYLSGQLSADRMVREYTQQCYLPASERSATLIANSGNKAKALSDWKSRVRTKWSAIAIRGIESGGVAVIPEVGEELTIRVEVDLAGLGPGDVSVEVIHGRAVKEDEILDPEFTVLTVEPASPAEGSTGSLYLFSGVVPLSNAGSFGYTIRILPSHPELLSKSEMGLAIVAQGADHG